MSSEPSAHFISYPKSGRTWIRYALHSLDLADAIHFHHDGFEFNDGARPPHDFDLSGRIARYRNKKVVYLTRDPRDVLVSLYFQVTGRFADFFAYDGGISTFIRDDYFGAGPLHRFRTMWAAIRAELPTHSMTYESMSADASSELAELLDYLHIVRPPTKFERPQTRLHLQT